MGLTTRIDEFAGLRSHLMAVAYRLTGTFADAEDAALQLRAAIPQ